MPTSETNASVRISAGWSSGTRHNPGESVLKRDDASRFHIVHIHALYLSCRFGVFLFVRGRVAVAKEGVEEREAEQGTPLWHFHTVPTTTPG